MLVETQDAWKKSLQFLACGASITGQKLLTDLVGFTACCVVDAVVALQEPAKALGASPKVGGQASGVDGPFGMAAMVEEFLADSFLQQLFAKYFAMLADEAPVLNRQLQSVSKQVQQLLEQRLGWDFQVQGVGQDDDEDEYAPVVVQLDNVTL